MTNFKSRAAGLLLAVAAAGMTATAALSAPITLPTGLNPGDQYRLAFITSTSGLATSTDINHYNAFVTSVANTQAELVALGTTWKVIGSTLAVNAYDNTNTRPTSAGGSLGVPIYLLDGVTLIANNNDDLWYPAPGAPDAHPGLLNPLNVNEQGNTSPVTYVHTGTTEYGYTRVTSPLGANGSTGKIRAGESEGYGSPYQWVSSTRLFNTDMKPFYALSDILTVSAATQAPEPHALGILGIGLAAIAVWRRRQRRAAA